MPKFQPGQSGNPKGRVRGSQNKATRMARALDKDLHMLLEKTKQAALDGDMKAMKLLLDRTLPPLKSAAPPTRILGLESLTGIADKAEAVLMAISRGDIPPDLGCQLISAIGSLGAIRELQEYEERLTRLEQLQQQNKSR